MSKLLRSLEQIASQSDPDGLARARNLTSPASVWLIGLVVLLLVLVLLVPTTLVLAFMDWLPIPGMPVESSALAKVASAPVAGNPVAGNKDLAITLQGLPDHMVEGKPVKVTILLTNSGVTTHQLYFNWLAPAFDVVPATQGLSSEVKKGQPDYFLSVPGSSAVVAEVTLTAREGSGQHPVMMDFWNRDALSYKSVISVAPVQFVSSSGRFGYRALFLVTGILKALAIPAGLVWLAVLFSESSKRREEKASSRQQDRDLSNSILTARIPEYRELVAEHYLVIARRGDTIAAEMLISMKKPVAAAGSLDRKAWSAAIDAELRLWSSKNKQAAIESDTPNPIGRLLCAVLLYRARLLKLLTKKGGIYFRSSHAERLYRDLIGLFFERLYEKLDKETFSETVAQIDPDILLSNLLRQLIAGQQAGQGLGGLAVTGQTQTPTQTAQIDMELYKDLFRKLKLWIVGEPDDFLAYVRLVQLSTRILDFECDRPFYQTSGTQAGEQATPEDGHQSYTNAWYFDPPTLDFQKEHYGYPEGLREGEARLDEKIKEYIDGVPAPCRNKNKGFPEFPR